MPLTVEIEEVERGIRQQFWLSPKKCIDQGLAETINKSRTFARKEAIPRALKKNTLLNDNRIKPGQMFVPGTIVRARASRLGTSFEIRANQLSPVDFKSFKETITGILYIPWRGASAIFVRSAFLIKRGLRDKYSSGRKGKVQRRGKANTAKGSSSDTTAAPSGFVRRLSIYHVTAPSMSTIFKRARIKNTVSPQIQSFIARTAGDDIKRVTRRGTCKPRIKR